MVCSSDFIAEENFSTEHKAQRLRYWYSTNEHVYPVKSVQIESS